MADSSARFSPRNEHYSQLPMPTYAEVWGLPAVLRVCCVPVHLPDPLKILMGMISSHNVLSFAPPISGIMCCSL
jgi:hypothetical protein